MGQLRLVPWVRKDEDHRCILSSLMKEERMVITGFLFTNCWLYRIYHWTQFLLELRNIMP